MRRARRSRRPSSLRPYQGRAAAGAGRPEAAGRPARGQLHRHGLRRPDACPQRAARQPAPEQTRRTSSRSSRRCRCRRARADQPGAAACRCRPAAWPWTARPLPDLPPSMVQILGQTERTGAQTMGQSLVVAPGRPTGSFSGSDVGALHGRARTSKAREQSVSEPRLRLSGGSVPRSGPQDLYRQEVREAFHDATSLSAAAMFLGTLLVLATGSWPLARPPRSRSGTTSSPVTTTRRSSSRPSSAARARCGCRASSSRWPASKATHVWDVVEDKHGNLFVATGDEGKIFKVSARRQSVGRLRRATDSQVLCLAAARRTARSTPAPGRAAGSSASPPTATPASSATARRTTSGRWPSTPRAKPSTPAPGRKGRIYQVTPEGKAERLLHDEAGARPVPGAATPTATSTPAPTRTAWSTASTPRARASSSTRRPQAEVRSLLVTPDGVYAGTSSPARRPLRRRRRAGVRFGDRAARVPATHGVRGVSDRADARQQRIRPQRAESAKAESKEKAHARRPSSPPPGTGENSVYRIAADGTVRELFREKALVLSLLRAGRPAAGRHRHGRPALRDRRGDQGKDRDRPPRPRPDPCLLPPPGRLDRPGHRRPGQALRPGRQHVDSGTVISEVLDAKIVSKWGTLALEGARRPPGTPRQRGGPQRQRRRAGRDLERLVGRADRRRAGRIAAPPPASCSTASR